MTPSLPAVVPPLSAAKSADPVATADAAGGFTELLMPLLNAPGVSSPGQAVAPEAIAKAPASVTAQTALVQTAFGRQAQAAKAGATSPQAEVIEAGARLPQPGIQKAAVTTTLQAEPNAIPALPSRAADMAARSSPPLPTLAQPGPTPAGAARSPALPAATAGLAPKRTATVSEAKDSKIDAAGTGVPLQNPAAGDLSGLLLAALMLPAAEPRAVPGTATQPAATAATALAADAAAGAKPAAIAAVQAAKTPPAPQATTLPQAGGEALQKAPFAPAAELLESDSSTAAPSTPNVDRPSIVAQAAATALNSAADPVRSHLDFAPREATDTAHMRVHVPVGDPRWGAAVGERLALAIGQGGEGNHRAELRLDPPELGSVSVHIDLKGDRATLNFFATSDTARDALALALPDLRGALASQGLTLAHTNIGSNAQAQAHVQQPQNAMNAGASETAEPEAAPMRTLRHGLVDDYA